MRKHPLGSKLHRLLLRFFFILLFLRVFADGERSAGIEVEASASTIQPIPHHVKIVVDRIERELTFTEDDDLYDVAAAFVAQYGIGGDNTAGQCGGRQSAYGCIVDSIVEQMTMKLANHVALEASRGERLFDIAHGPHGGGDKGRLRSLVVVDDILEYPYALREFGLSCEFQYKGNHPGRRTASFANHEAFKPLRRRVEELVGEPLPYWFASFQMSYANDTDNAVHRDYPIYRYSALLFLTPDAPPNLGTSTWRHRDTGFYGWPTETEARRNAAVHDLGANGDNQTLPEKLADMMHEKNMLDNEPAFEEIDRIGNRFNRLLIFNSRLNHRSSQLGGRGQNPDDARLFLVLFFNNEDKVGQENSVLWCDPDSAAKWGHGDTLGCLSEG